MDVPYFAYFVLRNVHYGKLRKVRVVCVTICYMRNIKAYLVLFVRVLSYFRLWVLCIFKNETYLLY